MSIPYVDANRIAEVLQFDGLIEHLRLGHLRPPPEVGRLLIEQKVTANICNAFLVQPAWEYDKHLGVKVGTYFPGNVDRTAMQSYYLLFDGKQGSPLALMDGNELTCWKTAADSALAASFLARKDAQTLLVVGAGTIVPHLIHSYMSIRPGIRRVIIWNRTAQKAESLLKRLEGQWPGVQLIASNMLEQAVRDADIVVCATSSATALIAGKWLQPGTHLDLVGAFTPQMREADDAAILRSRMYVDCRWTTLGQVGDLTQPIASGLIDEDHVLGDLFELCRGTCPSRTATDEITAFKSGGGAHLDLLTAQYIYTKTALA